MGLETFALAAGARKLEWWDDKIPHANDVRARAASATAFQQANALVKQACAADPRLNFIDAAPALRGADGQPRSDVFEVDGFHLNEEGYRVLTSVVRPYLLARLTAKIPEAPHCVKPPAFASDDPMTSMLATSSRVLARYMGPARHLRKETPTGAPLDADVLWGPWGRRVGHLPGCVFQSAEKQSARVGALGPERIRLSPVRDR